MTRQPHTRGRPVSQYASTLRRSASSRPKSGRPERWLSGPVQSVAGGSTRARARTSLPAVVSGAGARKGPATAGIPTPISGSEATCGWGCVGRGGVRALRLADRARQPLGFGSLPTRATQMRIWARAMQLATGRRRLRERFSRMTSAAVCFWGRPIRTLAVSCDGADCGSSGGVMPRERPAGSAMRSRLPRELRRLQP
jgi:hypothetical protein